MRLKSMLVVLTLGLACGVAYAGGAWSCAWVHKATAGNQAKGLPNVSRLSPPELSEVSKDAILVASHNWNPDGASNGVYFTQPFALLWNGDGWALNTLDKKAFPNDTCFNVIQAERKNGFVHVADAPTSNWTPIKNALCDGKPDATVIVTPNTSEGSHSGEHNIGVWYDAASKNWMIFNQDRKDMPKGARFNVVVGAAGNRLVADAKNTTAHMVTVAGTTYDHPKARIVVTQNWNAATSVYNDHPIGVWYDASKKSWMVYNEDRAPMPAGAEFNFIFQLD